MPELPDILLYLHAVRPRVVGRRIQEARIISPFVLRSFEPPFESVERRSIISVDRSGKQFIFDCGQELFIVAHLMIAGRWRWTDDPRAKAPRKITLATFTFDNGALHLVESSPQKRASLQLVQGFDELGKLDRGGLDVASATAQQFAQRLRSGNHTLKRALTDPRLFDGIGNAYSDEILHAARLSPIKLTSRLSDDEVASLHSTAKSILSRWAEQLIAEFGRKFPGPGDVTAFRQDFAVHGKFGRPCPVCATSVQRIRYAENETNYCPRCQTEGIVLADRSMSRLLKKDWPRTIDEWESR